MTLLITAEDIAKLPLSTETVIPIMEDLFRAAGHRTTENPARFRMPFRKGFLQFGPAALHDHNLVGFKLWANFGTKAREGWDFLFSTETSELTAIIHSFAISRMRTSATSGLAARYLSRPDAAVIGLYGAGRQAEAQVRAVCAVRRIEEVRVFSRTPANRESFCAGLTGRLGIRAVPVAEGAGAADADIVITMTNSDTPVLCGEWLKRPCLIIAAGANHWYKREIDGEVIERSALIVADQIEQAKVEGGDLLWAIAHGHLTWDRVSELGDVVVGRARLPDLTRETVLFESHGLAIEDVAVAHRAYELARERGLGQEISL